MPTQAAFKDGKASLIVHAEDILFFVVACLYSLFSFILLLMISTSASECKFCLVLEELNTRYHPHTQQERGVLCEILAWGSVIVRKWVQMSTDELQM